MKRLAATLALAAALSGCGGSTKPPAAAKPPTLPRALAREWAAKANAVAQALAAGDGCTALAHANELRDAVDGATIPARLRAQLVPAVDALPGRITCNPKPPKPPKEHHDHGPHHGNGQGNEG